MKHVLLQFIKRYKWLYILIIVCLIVDYSMWIIPTQMTQEIIDAMTNLTLTYGSLNQRVLIMLGAALTMYVTQYIWIKYLFGKSSQFSFELKQKMYQKIVNMRIPYFEKFRSGDMMTRFTNDIDSISSIIGYGLMSLMSTLGTYVILLPTMFIISWKVTLLALIPTVLIIFPIVWIGKWQEAAVEVQREAVAALSNEVLEVIEGIRVTRAYGNRAQAQAQFQAKTRDLAAKGDKIMLYQALYGRISMIVIGIMNVLVLYIGGLEMMAGHLTLGQVLALQLYSVGLTDPMWMLTDLILEYQTAKVSMQKIDELLETSDDLEVNGTQALTSIHSLALRDYSFQYQGAAAPSLIDIQLQLRKGQTLGIVGKTGSGKTTLVRQFLRQYPVGSGQFELNGQPITAFDRQTIEDKLGYVPQEHLLFSRTVQENIELGAPGASQKELDVAVAIASFTKDLERMAEGYQTMVGEKGVSISGGQKQRISIARAMVKQPELLILDDALSAVDARTERIIIENIQTLRAGKTNVITTHRLSAVEHADWIVVLDQGRIVEEGTSADLLAAGGWYYAQYQRQQAQASEAADGVEEV